MTIDRQAQQAGSSVPFWIVFGSITYRLSVVPTFTLRIFANDAEVITQCVGVTLLPWAVARPSISESGSVEIQGAGGDAGLPQDALDGVGRACTVPQGGVQRVGDVGDQPGAEHRVEADHRWCGSARWTASPTP